MFNLVGVLIDLKQCYLYVKNMDQIAIVVKNSPNDSCANCKPNSNLKQYLKVEKFWTKENYDLIEEHNFFEELQVDGD